MGAVGKGTHGAKDLTTLDIGGEGTQEAPTAVFEGFMDFLTAVHLKALPAPPVRVLVLNSTTMTERALERLRERSGSVYLFLDNDTTGRAHTAQFCTQLPVARCSTRRASTRHSMISMPCSKHARRSSGDHPHPRRAPRRAFLFTSKRAAGALLKFFAAG